jgi:hypothetical protein
MEHVWSHLYTKELSTAAEDHPLLLTESPINPRKNRHLCLSTLIKSYSNSQNVWSRSLSSRERAAEIFFERFNIPALFVSNQVRESTPAYLSLSFPLPFRAHSGLPSLSLGLLLSRPPTPHPLPDTHHPAGGAGALRERADVGPRAGLRRRRVVRG